MRNGFPCNQVDQVYQTVTKDGQKLHWYTQHVHHAKCDTGVRFTHLWIKGDSSRLNKSRVGPFPDIRHIGLADTVQLAGVQNNGSNEIWPRSGAIDLNNGVHTQRTISYRFEDFEFIAIV